MDEGGERCAELVLEKRKFVNIHILLVDDDATSLAVVSAMLRVCKYQVVTLKNPIEALDTLRARKGFFDLVVTDLHMPEMNGLQLQKQVMQEFKLPVIMMSADEKPSVILKSLEEGVAFYMVKPISLDDVKHVWQYAITARQVTPNQTTIIRRELSIDIEKSSLKESSSLAPCSREEIKSKYAKYKNKKAKENRVAKNSIAIRKPKVIWTNSLHNRFLQAIRLLGLDKAVPKKILEFMNVPGLTRENVASHLQKYRIFLKRVAEKGARSMKIYSDSTLLRSNFASAHFKSPSYRSKFQSQHPKNFPENQQLMAPLKYQSLTLGANLSHLNFPNPNLEGTSMQNHLAHFENQKYLSLLTINKLKFPNFNGLALSSIRDEQNFVFMGNEFENPRRSSNGMKRTTREDQMICSGRNELAPLDLKNGGLSLDGGCESGGSLFENFEGINQLLQVVSNTNNVEKNGSEVLVSSEEEVSVNILKADNESIAYGDHIGEDQNCFDVLSEIFMGHNHNQTSLRKEEMAVDMDLSDIWNGIEMDASAKELDLQPSSLSAQGWDDDILEIFFGDGSS